MANKAINSKAGQAIVNSKAGKAVSNWVQNTNFSQLGAGLKKMDALGDAANIVSGATDLFKNGA